VGAGQGLIVYFDSSALASLFLPDEPSHPLALEFWRSASRAVIGQLAYPEVRAAFAVAVHVGRLAPNSAKAANRRLDRMFEAVHVVDASRAIARQAGDLAERHLLRGFDAVHLATALSLEVDGLLFATHDVRLSRAAVTEGLSVPARPSV
jgi:predicted nucleic acid-binding protein